MNTHMRPRGRTRLLTLAVALVAMTSTADLAAAKDGPCCRGSAARGGALGIAEYEPVVANAAADPCVTDAGRSVGVAPLAGLTAVNPTAATVRTAGIAGASAGVEHISGTLAGAVPLDVGVLRAQQTVACGDGRAQASGSSSVESLSIGGTPLPAVVGSAPADITVPTPVGDIRVRANQVTAEPNGITRSALILDLPGGDRHVFGEATAGGDACQPIGGAAPGTAPGASPCPAGSEYSVADNVCFISTATSGDDTRIVVGRPYDGPGGGTVVSLTQARKRFGNRRCLAGDGPRYAVVGTNRENRITGTNGPDRILTLGGNDRADGGRGDDCLDGGTGSDRLSGALGNDVVYGLSGKDAINGGGGTDRLSGGVGNDTINAAYGADRVFGGGGRDAINVATSGRKARVSCGKGRDTVRINSRERRSTRGCERRYVLRDK